MFNPKVMTIKMSKMTHFLHFFTKCSKKLVIVWTDYLSASKRFYLAVVSKLPLARCQNLEIQDFGVVLLTQ